MSAECPLRSVVRGRRRPRPDRADTLRAMRRLRLRHLLILALITGPLTLVGLLWLFAWLMRPDPVVDDLVDRAPPAVEAPVVVPRRLDEAITVQGRVQYPDGSPAAGVVVELEAPGAEPTLLTSEQDGR